MSRNIKMLFEPCIYASIHRHLFPGDGNEHAGVLLCGWTETSEQIALSVKAFIPARDGIDYTLSPAKHGRLEPLFIDGVLTKAQEQGLAYIAIHNHDSSDSVGFSAVDLRSHEYGYPTLKSLNPGLPVGAAVFGTESVELDLWMPSNTRHQLLTARVVGRTIKHLWASPLHAPTVTVTSRIDRQLPFLRNIGQGLLSQARIGIIGLGGLGSQLLEPLIRLGVTKFILIDPDRIESSNYSRLHGARPTDLGVDGAGAFKVDIAARALKEIDPNVEVIALPIDVARGDAYKRLLTSDFLFLAADTPEARLTCNALSHQHFLPVAQVGTKVQIDKCGDLQGVFGAVRQVRPGSGCLWCNGLIDRAGLANAAKSAAQRNSEEYGVKAANPAVVTFNAEVAARALNTFLLQYTDSRLPTSGMPADYVLLDLLSGEQDSIEAAKDLDCPFCDARSSLFGSASTQKTPVISQTQNSIY